MSSHSVPTRTLPNKPSVALLGKEAEEFCEFYQSGKVSAVAEVARFEPDTDPVRFVLTDAERMLARSYGFSSWDDLKAHVDSLNEIHALKQAMDTNDFKRINAMMMRDMSFPNAASGTAVVR